MLGTDLKIAIFGDTHGHLRLALQLCRLWQLDNGRHLDAVLQCGDLGFFPNPERLDKATRRFAKKDPEELGFWRYFALQKPQKRDELVEKILLGPPDSLQTLRGPFLWCNGNHEDFASLHEIVGEASLKAVDYYERLIYMRSGSVATLHFVDGNCTLTEKKSTEGLKLKVAALGGGPLPEEAEKARSKDCRKYVNEKAAEELLGKSFDVLLTHCGPEGPLERVGRMGSAEIEAVIISAKPAWNFFAHYTSPIAPSSIGKTQCHWLNDVKFDSGTGCLEASCMGILTIGADGAQSFEVLASDWLKRVVQHSWMYL